MSNSEKKFSQKQNNSALNREVSWGRISFNQRVLFAKNMSVMIKSGLTVSESLLISADAAQGKFKKVVSAILASVEAGGTFSEGLGKFPRVFSPLFINSVYAGEASGTLEDNLTYVAEQLRKEKELSGKIKGAMLYPAVVLTATFILGMGITFFILPKLTPLFEGMKIQLPPTTKFLIWFSHIVQYHGFALFFGIVIFIAAVTWFIRQKFSRPLTHWIMLRIPIVKSMTHNSNLARFSRTLGTLIKSGLTIDESILITAQTAGNYYYATALTTIGKGMISGNTLAENMIRYEFLFPKFMVSMIHVGERSGRLEEVLLYLASYFEEEVDEDAKNLSTAIEPILLLGIGLVVGFLAIAIITPIYNITGSISNK
jgi:type IV pilus assembly protein PilC